MSSVCRMNAVWKCTNDSPACARAKPGSSATARWNSAVAAALSVRLKRYMCCRPRWYADQASRFSVTVRRARFASCSGICSSSAVRIRDRMSPRIACTSSIVPANRSAQTTPPLRVSTSSTVTTRFAPARSIVPGQAIPDAQHATDFAHVGIVGAQAKRRAACRDEQPAQSREFGDQFVGQGVGDGCVSSRIADEAKRQHRDRGTRRNFRRLSGGQVRRKRFRELHDPGDLHVGDEAETLAVDRADEPLRLAVVTERLPCGLDATREGGVGDDAPIPDLVEDLVPRDQSFAVLDQQGEQGEDLRFDGLRLAAGPQFCLRSVEFKGAEAVEHGSEDTAGWSERPETSMNSPCPLQASAGASCQPLSTCRQTKEDDHDPAHPPTDPARRPVRCPSGLRAC